MTSEGQHAGQPAEATSGGPTSGGFPPDPDAQRIAGRATAQTPAEGFPNSYGPPPATAPGGGSPFVVPAVSTFGAGSGQGGTSYGSARAPQPEASPYGSVSPEGAGTTSPYGSSPGQYGQPATPPPPSGSALASGAASVPPPAPFDGGQQPSWSPPSAAAAPPAADPGVPPSFGAGFPPPAAPEPSGGRVMSSGLPARTPGATAPEDGGLGRSFSAFGDQPVRVPGASLANLPDNSAPGSFSTTPAQNGWMQDVRSPETADPAPAPASTAFPSRRGDGGGFPLRAPAGPGVESPSGSQPSLDLPIRGQQPFGSTQPESAHEPFSGATSTAVPPFGNPSMDPSRGPLGGSFAPSGEGPAFGGGSFPQPAETPAFGSSSPQSAASPAFGGSFSQPADAPAFGSSFPAEGLRDGGEQPPSATGYPQRVPGAALSTGGALPSPAPADDQTGGSPVPQPRDPAKKPAVGSARPVTASASVPGVRVTPAEVAELPPPAGPAPQARVYGRPAAPAPESTESTPPGNGESPSGGHPAPPAGVPAESPYGGRPGGPPEHGEFGGAAPPYPPAHPSGQPHPDESPSGGFPAAPPFGGAQQGDNQPGGFPPVPVSPFGNQPSRVDNPYGSPAQGSQFGDPGASFADGPQSFAAGPQPGDASPNGPFGAPQPGTDPAGGYPPPPAPPFGGPQPGDGFPPAAAAPFGPPQGNDPFGVPQHRAENPSGGFGLPNSTESAQPGGYPPPVFGAAPQPGGSPDGDRFQPPSGDVHGGPDGFASPGGPGVAPQSPARATARATASARVTPPEPPPGGASPFAMPGSAPLPGGDGQQFQGAGDPGAPSPFPGGGPAMPGSPQYPGQFGAPGEQSGSPYGAFAPGEQSGSPYGAFAPGEQSGSPYGGFTPDPAGRGPVPGGFPDQYNEHTTDVSGRGGSSYVPAPALPPMPGEQPGGAYPSPAARATVTPPGPEDTTSWPGPAGEQGSSDSSKADSPAPAPAPSAKVNVRTIPVALAVVLGAALLLSLVFGLVYLISGDDFSVSQGECVKRDGNTPVAASCNEPNTFQVVSIVTAKEQCGDATQPYIVVPKDDGDQVLCLKKNG